MIVRIFSHFIIAFFSFKKQNSFWEFSKHLTTLETTVTIFLKEDHSPESLPATLAINIILGGTGRSSTNQFPNLTK